MPENNLLAHVKDDTLWKAAGVFVSGLLASLMGLLRMLYKRDRKAIEYLYTWKDDTVDPHIKAVAVEYVRQPYCNRNHDEIRGTYEKRHTELMNEVLSIRGILLKHLVNGNAAKE